MSKILGFIGGTLVIMVLIGLFLCWWIDETAPINLTGEERVAIIIFWPFLSISLGVMGLVSILIKAWSKLIALLDKEEEK